MGGLDIIMACNFYQANPIWYSWIFKSKINGFNVLMTIFWFQNALRQNVVSTIKTCCDYCPK